MRKSLVKKIKFLDQEEAKEVILLVQEPILEYHQRNPKDFKVVLKTYLISIPMLHKRNVHRSVNIEKGTHLYSEIHVKKWVDYSTKYGLGYLLSDGSTGVYFNDSTKIILDRGGETF